MQQQMEHLVPVPEKLSVSSEGKRTHILNNTRRTTEQQINKLEMINR